MEAEVYSNRVVSLSESDKPFQTNGNNIILINEL
jgi:hypothetical protein